MDGWRRPTWTTPAALGTWLRRPAGLAALTLGSPPSQRLVVEVIEKRRQQLSGSQELLGNRQSGMETPRQLLRRRVALVRGDPTEHYVHISCLHRCPSLARVVSSRRPATVVRVAAPPDVGPPRRAAGR